MSFKLIWIWCQKGKHFYGVVSWVLLAVLTMYKMSELRSSMKVKVTILGSLSLVVIMVSVDIKQH